jgi:hypothetical protein
MALTRITPSADVAQHEAVVQAEFEDGSVEHLHVEHARGTPARPLTDRDLIEKFVAALALGGMPEAESLGARILAEPNMPLSKLMDHLT